MKHVDTKRAVCFLLLAVLASASALAQRADFLVHLVDDANLPVRARMVLQIEGTTLVVNAGYGQSMATLPSNKKELSVRLLDIQSDGNKTYRLKSNTCQAEAGNKIYIYLLPAKLTEVTVADKNGRPLRKASVWLRTPRLVQEEISSNNGVAKFRLPEDFDVKREAMGKFSTVIQGVEYYTESMPSARPGSTRIDLRVDTDRPLTALQKLVLHGETNRPIATPIEVTINGTSLGNTPTKGQNASWVYVLATPVRYVESLALANYDTTRTVLELASATIHVYAVPKPQVAGDPANTTKPTKPGMAGADLETLIRQIAENNRRLKQEISKLRQRVAADLNIKTEQKARLLRELQNLEAITLQNDQINGTALQKARNILTQIASTMSSGDAALIDTINAQRMRIEAITATKLKLEEEKRESEVRFQRNMVAALSIVGLLLVLLLIAYIIAKRMQRQKEEIALRMEEINRKNEEIMAQNEMLHIQREEIQRQNQRLQDLNTEKNNLMDIVAHDLKAPLNKVVGITQLLPVVGELNEEQKNFITIIRRAAFEGTRFIEDLLDINAIEQGMIATLRPETIGLAVFVPELLKGFQYEAAAKNIRIHFQNKSLNGVVETDKDYLKRIVDNIVSNALKFSEQGKNIYVKVFDNQDKVNISIRDEGPGIDDEDQKKLFRKFQRLSAKPTAGESSTGLGLSIVKVLLDRLQGEVGVRSELGRGTEFVIALPKQSQTVNV